MARRVDRPGTALNTLLGGYSGTDPDLRYWRRPARAGLCAADLKCIILSHFHADHISGLQDFPAARIIVTREAYDAVASRRGFGALRRGFIPALLPADFQQRARFLDDFSGPSLPHLGPT